MNRMSLIAAVAAACLASACQSQATSPPTPAEPLITTLVLDKGMTGDIGPNATLTFVKVVGDSRCPQGVQCIWAGEVTIALKIAVGSAIEDFELSTHGSPSRTVKGYGVDLVSFEACPGGPAVTPLPGECATLKVAPAP